MTVFCAFAAEKFDVELNVNPYTFELLRSSGANAAYTNYGAGARVSLDWVPANNFVVGADFFSEVGLAKNSTAGHIIMSYMADVKCGGFYDFGKNRVGADVKIGLDASHIFTTSTKASFMVGGDAYYRYNVNDVVAMNLGCDVLWTLNKGAVADGKKVNSLFVLPYVGISLMY